MTSIHYVNDRYERETLIREIGYGVAIKSVVIDRGHVNGPEIHTISSTGIITIQNQRTHKMITRLIARPGQIARYYERREEIPAGLMEIAYAHLQMRYNER